MYSRTPQYRKVFCSFADSRMARALVRIQQQASQMGCYDQIYCYNEHNLDKDFRRKLKDKLQPGSRGFGYWAWKPQIILQTLREMKEGDILSYCDAGCHLNPQGLTRLQDYFDMVAGHESGILVCRMGHKESKWTKMDLFHHFGVAEDRSVTDSGQYVATAIFIRKQKTTVDLLQQWRQVVYDHFHLVDDSPSISPNFPEFVEHRHDQSILSILLKLHGCVSVPIGEFDAPIYFKRDRMLPMTTRDGVRRIFLTLQLSGIWKLFSRIVRRVRHRK